MELSAGKVQPGGESSVTWVVWEARGHLIVAAVFLVLILLLTGGIYLTQHDPFMAGLALFILLIAVLPYYLPVRYTLDASGVLVQSLLGNRRQPWGNLKVYFPDGDRGVLLSPVKAYGLMARSLGIYLPFRGNADAARRLVARHLPEGQVRGHE